MSMLRGVRAGVSGHCTKGGELACADAAQTYVALDKDFRLFGINAAGQVKGSDFVRRLLELHGVMRNSNCVEVHLFRTIGEKISTSWMLLSEMSACATSRSPLLLRNTHKHAVMI